MARRPEWLQFGRVGVEGLDGLERDPGQTCRTQERVGLDRNRGTLWYSFNLEVVFTFLVASCQNWRPGMFSWSSSFDRNSFLSSRSASYAPPPTTAKA